MYNIYVYVNICKYDYIHINLESFSKLKMKPKHMMPHRALWDYASLPSKRDGKKIEEQPRFAKNIEQKTSQILVLFKQILFKNNHHFFPQKEWKKDPHPLWLFSGAYSSSPVHPTRPSLPRPRPPMGDIQSRPSRVVGCPRSYVTRSAEKVVVNGWFLEVGWFTAPENSDETL